MFFFWQKKCWIENQSVSSRIWTRVAVSNSYGDNHYTMGTSWVDDRKIVYHCAKDFQNNTPQTLNSEFFLLPDWLPYKNPVFPTIYP